MIATCKFCREILHPVSILPLKPAQLAKIPPEQLEVMKFSAGVTEHIRATHPEYIAMVHGLAGTFIGHCMVSAVEVAGENHAAFTILTAHDDELLRAHWDAMPNPPHPDIVAQIEGETQARLTQLMAEVGGGVGGADNVNALTPALSATPATPAPPPPGRIKLN